MNTVINVHLQGLELHPLELDDENLQERSSNFVLDSPVKACLI